MSLKVWRVGRVPVLFMVLAVLATGLVTGPAATAAPGCPTQRSRPVPVSAGTTPVILVHGWTGSASDLESLGDYLKKSFGSRISVQYFDYGPDSTSWASNPAIASCLAHFIHGVTDKNKLHAVLVAHSMGGLAIRFATSNRYTDQPIGKDQIARVITIDTPHRGSPFGGNHAGELGQIFNELKARHRFPPSGSDGARCLAPHSASLQLPSGCATPPYMPTVDLTSISGQNTVIRTLFGRELYRIDQSGDGIVPATSQAGYPGSAGNPTPTGYRLAQPDVSCTQTTDQTLAIAAQLVPPVPAKVLSTWAKAIGGMLAESQTIADITAGKLTLFSGASWLMTALTSRCGHTQVIAEPKTKQIVQADVERALAGAASSRDESATSSAIRGPLGVGQTAHFPYFDVTVDSRRRDGAVWGAHVRVCYTHKHPFARSDGTTRVSTNPWLFGSLQPDGRVVYSKNPTIDARVTDYWRPAYGEKLVRVGECHAGWVSVALVEAVNGFRGMQYAPSDFAFSATWRW